MTDYTDMNEKFQKFIDENELGKLFGYTGKDDTWEYKGSYPAIRFYIHNKPRTIEWLIRIAFDCGQHKGVDDQINRTVRNFKDLISPTYQEFI
jgi:hypothetical protein